MTDYTKKILDNVPNWWTKESGSNNYEFVYSFENEFNNTETQLDNFKKGWQINYAEGYDLDKIALKYNLVRNQYDTDNSFRQKIKTYLLTFSGSGTETDFKDILSFLTGLDTDDISIELVRELLINVNIAIDDSTDLVILNGINTYLPNIKAAGVYILNTNYTSSNNIFRLNLSGVNSEDTLL